MEVFPKALAIGNIRRRLQYWWRNLEATSAFENHPRTPDLNRRVLQFGGGISYAAILELLADVGSPGPTADGQAVMEIAASSVLLRERTSTESKLFTNNRLLAQTMTEDSKHIQWELQRFLFVRNKLVHRARIDHPLLVVVAERAKARLYDLLRDIGAQLTVHRIVSSVSEVLQDYRDTFQELVADLGKATTLPENFSERIWLA